MISSNTRTFLWIDLQRLAVIVYTCNVVRSCTTLFEFMSEWTLTSSKSDQSDCNYLGYDRYTFSLVAHVTKLLRFVKQSEIVVAGRIRIIIYWNNVTEGLIFWYCRPRRHVTYIMWYFEINTKSNKMEHPARKFSFCFKIQLFCLLCLASGLLITNPI